MRTTSDATLASQHMDTIPLHMRNLYINGFNNFYYDIGNDFIEGKHERFA